MNSSLTRLRFVAHSPPHVPRTTPPDEYQIKYQTMLYYFMCKQMKFKIVLELQFSKIISYRALHVERGDCEVNNEHRVQNIKIRLSPTVVFREIAHPKK